MRRLFRANSEFHALSVRKKPQGFLRNGMEVTVDCSSGEVGKIYSGKLPFKVMEHKLDKIPQTKTK